MNKYLVKAYPRPDYGLRGQEKIIEANNIGEAWQKAYKMFDEYDEVGVWEYGG